MDGGIRSGQDLLKALALGAKGTLIGRAFNFGLGAMGEAGVTTALEIIQRGLDTTMALCAARTIGEIGRQPVAPPYWALAPRLSAGPIPQHLRSQNIRPPAGYSHRCAP